MDILVDNKPIKGRNRRKSKTKGSHPNQYGRAAQPNPQEQRVHSLLVPFACPKGITILRI